MWGDSEYTPPSMRDPRRSQWDSFLPKKPKGPSPTDVAVSQLGGEVLDVQQEEESRGQRFEDLARSAFEKSNVPTWTDESFNTALARATNAGSEDFLRGQDALRSYLGGAGVTGGGLAAGLATGAELTRLGQATAARTNLYLERVRDTARDAVSQFQNAMTYGANAINRPPSTVYADYLSSLVTLRDEQEGRRMADKASKRQADASKTAGALDFVGGLAKAFVPFL